MTPSGRGSLQRLWPAALLVVAAAAPYLFTLHFPFIFDDYGTVPRNPRITTLWPITQPLTVDPNTSLSSRPLAQLSLAVNYAMSGLSPWSYRLTNIALHAASALLVWRLLARVLRGSDADGRADHRRSLLAWAVALVWALHPLNTETVVYVTQRTELLVSFFLLATVAAALRGFDAEARGAVTSTRGWWAVAVACCWLGMGSKEVMAGAPLLVLLADRALASGTFGRAIRRHWPIYAGMAASWALLAGLVVLSPRDESAGFGVEISPLHYLYTQAGVLVLYLRLAFWPHPLSVVYHVDIVETLGGALPHGLLIVAMLVVTGVAVWRNQLLGIAGAWFFLILAPSSSIVPITTEVAAERRMYLPLVAVLAVTFVAVHRGLQALPPRVRLAAGRGPLAAVAVACAVASVGRLRVYATELGVWEDAMRKQPRSYLAHQGYGNMLLRQGDRERGFQHRLRAVELNPYLPERTLEVASMLADRGRLKEALHWLTHLTQHADPNAVVLVNRGGILAHLGRETEAEADLRRAMELDPTLAEPWLNLGVMRARQGRLKEARQWVVEALKRNPDSAQAKAVLGQLDRDLAAQRAGEAAP